MGWFRKEYKSSTVRYFHPVDHAVLKNAGKLVILNAHTFATAMADVPEGCYLVGYYKNGSDMLMPVLEDEYIFNLYEQWYFSRHHKMLRCFYIIDQEAFDKHVKDI